MPRNGKTLQNGWVTKGFPFRGFQRLSGWVPIGLQRAARNSHDDFGCQKPFQEGHIGIPLPLNIMQAVINTDLDG